MNTTQTTASNQPSGKAGLGMDERTGTAGRTSTAGLSIDAPLSELRFPPVVMLSPSATIAQAARRLHEANVSSLVLDTPERLFLTERDVVRAVSSGVAPSEPAEAIASRSALWVTTTTRLVDAAEIMCRHEVRHLLVLDPISAEPIGILSMRDLLPMFIDDFHGSHGPAEGPAIEAHVPR